MALSTGSKVFGVVVLSVLGGMIYALLQFNSADAGDEGGEPVTVEIPEGVAAAEVGNILSDAGVVGNPVAFQFKLRTDPRAQQIRPGTYELRTGMDDDAILDELTEEVDAAPAFTVVIPEGLTVPQTLERIAEAEDSPFTVRRLRRALAGVALPAWVPAELPDAAEPFEGLLAPNTYEFRVDVNPQELLSQLVVETDANLRDLGVPQRRFYRTLTTASLIEREVRVPEERPIVASVITNRLEIDEPLGIDATVQYAQGERGTRVLQSDTQVDSPWNTYRNIGLPPTPIAAPGTDALEAAANPADTDFIFYVVCDFDTGAHAFTTNLTDHNRNVAQYRRIRDAQTGSYCADAA